MVVRLEVRRRARIEFEKLAEVLKNIGYEERP